MPIVFIMMLPGIPFIIGLATIDKVLLREKAEQAEKIQEVENVEQD